MEIRKATEADIPGLETLLLQVGQVHHEIRPDIFRPGCLKYTREELALLLQQPEKPVYAAFEDGRMLGYCFCQFRDYRGSSGVSTPRLELYIDDLCVDEKVRGKGVATALYRFVCAIAREAGCAFINLNVWCGNHSAMAFYEKMGMRQRNIMMEMPLENE
jgi:ribosomal protein S18 acetylase RimI-like enzyme